VYPLVISMYSCWFATNCKGKIVRASASRNFNSTLFFHLKKSLYHYTISFYNTSSISNFYFPILLIKIIYLHNKIYFVFFYFFPIFSSTFPQPLSPHLHCPVTTTVPPPCPPRHNCPLPTKIPSKQKPILKKKKKNPHSMTHVDQTQNPDLANQA